MQLDINPNNVRGSTVFSIWQGNDTVVISSRLMAEPGLPGNTFLLGTAREVVSYLCIKSCLSYHASYRNVVKRLYLLICPCLEKI